MTTRRTPPPPSPLPSQRAGAAPSGVWLGKGTPSAPRGVTWLVRPMPDGQWPPEHHAPRDDSFSWWVRSSCGHQGGAKQWAFYAEGYARLYEDIFKLDPCRWSACSMIKNGRE